MHGSLRSLTDEAGIIYILEKVHGSLRSLTDEASIIYVLEKVHGSLRSIMMRQVSSMYWRKCMVLSGPELMR